MYNELQMFVASSLHQIIIGNNVPKENYEPENSVWVWGNKLPKLQTSSSANWIRPLHSPQQHGYREL